VPTYQYRCTDCGEGLEVVQKFTDDALTECPSCTGRLRKVFSAVGVVFKGSGFYRTDSREAKAPAASANGSPAANGSMSSGSGSASSGSVASSSSAA
jgi:putative FmdB family regulatory protein